MPKGVPRSCLSRSYPAWPPGRIEPDGSSEQIPENIKHELNQIIDKHHGRNYQKVLDAFHQADNFGKYLLLETSRPLPTDGCTGWSPNAAVHLAFFDYDHLSQSIFTDPKKTAN